MIPYHDVKLQDNAAMIAWAGYEMFQEGFYSDFEITQQGKWPINQIMNIDMGWRRIDPPPKS